MQKSELCKRLEAAGIENAAMEAVWLLERFSGEALEQAIDRRCRHYPLQYLLGEWEFYRETYEVSENCLIPRPDTELLVEQAIKRLPPGARFLDLCTGSGCVAISTLCARPDTSAVAVDLFDSTLELAQRNALRNGVAERIELSRADVLDLPPCEWQGEFSAILSNPPYIRAADMLTLQPEVCHEPAAALDGGRDGLDFYRAILKNWRQVLTPGGFLLLEIGYDQAAELSQLADEQGLCATVFRDFGGNDRVVLVN